MSSRRFISPARFYGTLDDALGVLKPNFSIYVAGLDCTIRCTNAGNLIINYGNGEPDRWDWAELTTRRRHELVAEFADEVGGDEYFACTWLLHDLFYEKKENSSAYY